MTLFRRSLLAPALFLGLWLLWFALPPTRDAARSAGQARFSPSATPWPQGNDRDALVAQAYAANGEQQRAAAFVALSQRFPNDAAILAQIVMFQADGLHIGQTRQPGPSSNPSLSWSVKLNEIKKPAPQQLRDWFAVCGRGAQLEPNNTFWDWMQIIGLLAARRDDEVWSVLRRARSKTGYDDHASDVAQAQLRVARRRNRALSPLDQISIQAATLFPHYAVMREAARELSDDASGLRLRGTAQGQTTALEGMRDLVFLSRTMRRESKPFIGSLVGQAMEAIALRGGTYSPFFVSVSTIAPAGAPLAPPPGGPPGAPPLVGSPPTGPMSPTPTPLPPGVVLVPRLISGSPLSAYANDPRSLLRLARTIKRSDVAAQLATEWNVLGVWQARVQKFQIGNSMPGIDGRTLLLASLSDALGAVLLSGMPSLLLLALSGALLLRLVPSWRRQQRELTLSRGSWIGGAALGFACVPVLVSAVLVSALLAWRTPGTKLSNLPFVWLFSGPPSGSAFPSAPPAWSQNLPAVALFLLALACAAAWENRRQGRKSLGARLRALFQEPDDGLTRFDAAPLLSLVWIVTATFLATVGVVAFLVVPALNSDFAGVHDYAGVTLFGFACVLALPELLRLRSSASRAFALALAARFAWSFLIAGTLAWGLLWLGTTPARTRFDAQMDRYLQLGEFQLIRQQLGL